MSEEGKKKKGFLGELMDNVSDSASFLADKVVETSAKAYAASSEAIEETNEKFHNFTDKQALLKEKKKLEGAQQDLVFRYGEVTMNQFLENGTVGKDVLNGEELTKLIEQYKANIETLKELEVAIENHK